MTMGAVAKEDGVLKLVHPGGLVELHNNPITAAEVMKKNPRHCVTRPDVFKFPWIVVRPESVLNPGKVFFIVPHHTIRRLLHSNGYRNLPSQPHGSVKHNQDSGRPPLKRTSPSESRTPKRERSRVSYPSRFYKEAQYDGSVEFTHFDHLIKSRSPPNSLWKKENLRNEDFEFTNWRRQEKLDEAAPLIQFKQSPIQLADLKIQQDTDNINEPPPRKPKSAKNNINSKRHHHKRQGFKVRIPDVTLVDHGTLPRKNNEAELQNSKPQLKSCLKGLKTNHVSKSCRRVRFSIPAEDGCNKELRHGNGRSNERAF